jgi:hypothetical protein
MSAYQNWTRGYAKQLVQRELMDTTNKWFSDAELNMYVNDWQNELQQEFELVWGSATITTILNTLTLGTISPPMHRLEAVYFGTGTSSGYRLAGRLLQDLERANTEWRNATANTPREVIQYDSQTMIVWPPLSQTGTFIFEYPTILSFNNDSTPISLPAWTQWSLKPYVCWKCYLRPGPTNDPRRAQRYLAQFLKAKARIRLLWDNFLPERFRKLKPAHHYEWDILHPPGAWDTGSNALGLSVYTSEVPAGPIDGVNATFTLNRAPTSLQLYVGGTLQTAGTNYTLSGATITFLAGSIPAAGSTMVAWLYYAY